MPISLFVTILSGDTLKFIMFVIAQISSAFVILIKMGYAINVRKIGGSVKESLGPTTIHRLYGVLSPFVLLLTTIWLILDNPSTFNILSQIGCLVFLLFVIYFLHFK